jgi:VacB/RNase II family 3'-5' exoribonuclease
MTSHPHIDLRARARQAMLDNGFTPEMSPDVDRQLRALSQQTQSMGPTPVPTRGVRDLRGLLWSSIDNDESRDLDQIEVAEPLPGNRFRVLVGIADVDALVPSGSPIDLHARDNTTSVYTGVETFPMLPNTLSEGLTSLLEDVDRLCMVVEMTLDSTGNVTSSDIYPALTRNRAKLTYEAVGAWLEGHGPLPPQIAQSEGLEVQIHLQRQIARQILARRLEQGALEFETVEAQPVVRDSKVIDLAVLLKNEARLIIENFMIAANTTLAAWMTQSGQPSIQRVVRAPERWNRITAIAQSVGDTLPDVPDARALSDFLARRKAADPLHFPDLSLSIVKLLGPGEYVVVEDPSDPQGHFGLAAYRYTHSTAPNRRYADLIVQRLLKAVVSQSPPPYAIEELTQIAARCTERENAARKVERVMRKVIAATLLSDRIGQMFDALVTGATPKGTYVRVIAPPVEGRVVRGEEGLDVGDKVRVRLLATDPERGFIDFERL